MVDNLLYPVTSSFPKRKAAGNTLIHTIVYYFIRYSNTDSSVSTQTSTLQAVLPHSNRQAITHSGYHVLLEQTCSFVGQSNKGSKSLPKEQISCEDTLTLLMGPNHIRKVMGSIISHTHRQALLPNLCQINCNYWAH